MILLILPRYLLMKRIISNNLVYIVMKKMKLKMILKKIMMNMIMNLIVVLKMKVMMIQMKKLTGIIEIHLQIFVSSHFLKNQKNIFFSLHNFIDTTNKPKYSQKIWIIFTLFYFLLILFKMYYPFICQYSSFILQAGSCIMVFFSKLSLQMILFW